MARVRRRKSVMAYVIASTCIDVKDGACQEACPVECIYESGRMMVIQPDECIDCGLCPSVCPVDAIYASEDLPEGERVRTRQRRILRSRGHGLGLDRRRRFDPRQRARSSARRDARQVTSKRTRAGNLEHDESGRRRRRRDANGRARAISLLQIRISAIPFPFAGSNPRLARRPAAREKGERNFFYFFRRNPLKSPDSDE